MLGRQHEERGTEQRIRARREHLDPGVRGYLEPDVRALAPADPVPLHRLQRVRPVEPVQVLDKAVGEGRDAEHPLAHPPTVDRVVADQGPAVGADLFVRQDRAEPGAPVDRRVVKEGEPVGVHHPPPRYLIEFPPRQPVRVRGRRGGPAALLEFLGKLLNRAGLAGVRIAPGVEYLQEYPLRPPVIRRVRRGDLAARVMRQSKPPELPPHVGDILLRRHRWMLACLDGVLLRGQAERVKAERVQDGPAVHAHVPGVDVRRDVPERMPDMQARP